MLLEAGIPIVEVTGWYGDAKDESVDSDDDMERLDAAVVVVLGSIVTMRRRVCTFEVNSATAAILFVFILVCPTTSVTLHYPTVTFDDVHNCVM